MTTLISDSRVLLNNGGITDASKVAYEGDESLGTQGNVSLFDVDGDKSIDALQDGWNIYLEPGVSLADLGYTEEHILPKEDQIQQMDAKSFATMQRRWDGEYVRHSMIRDQILGEFYQGLDNPEAFSVSEEPLSNLTLNIGGYDYIVSATAMEPKYETVNVAGAIRSGDPLRFIMLQSIERQTAVTIDDPATIEQVRSKLAAVIDTHFPEEVCNANLPSFE